MRPKPRRSATKVGAVVGSVVVCADDCIPGCRIVKAKSTGPQAAHSFGGRLRGKKVQSQLSGKKPGCDLTFNAISSIVESRGESAEPALSRGDGDHPTADPAFAGQPGFIQPVAGV